VPELFVATCGVVAGTAVWVTSRVEPTIAHPSVYPISWPQITLLPLLGILVAALPAVLTPPPPGASGTGSPELRHAATPGPAVVDEHRPTAVTTR
jgi:energy-coupling factor transport system permease protein